ncbi:hypothetical protein ACTGJ9_036390 [Bradyrhizobium sp. RDM12]
MVGIVRLIIPAWLFFIGVASTVWGAASLPIFAKRYELQRAAAAIIDGRIFDTEYLRRLLVASSPANARCEASKANAQAIVQLRLYEAAVSSANREGTSVGFQELQHSVAAALSCNPSLSFLWLLSYWIDVNQNGLNKRSIDFLRMSYDTGPYEGWIAVKRNGFALAVLDQLPPDMADRVKREFAALVRSSFYVEAYANLMGAGWTKRDVLLAGLSEVPELKRYEFAKYARSKGSYLDIPGLEPFEQRPWR